jgi:hypothetical protein
MSEYVCVMTWTDAEGVDQMEVFETDAAAIEYAPAFEFERTFVGKEVRERVGWYEVVSAISRTDEMAFVRKPDGALITEHAVPQTWSRASAEGFVAACNRCIAEQSNAVPPEIGVEL